MSSPILACLGCKKKRISRKGAISKNRQSFGRLDKNLDNEKHIAANFKEVSFKNEAAAMQNAEYLDERFLAIEKQGSDIKMKLDEIKGLFNKFP